MTLFKLLLSAVLAILALLGATAARAAPLAASISGVGSGSFGGVDFFNRRFSISSVGETLYVQTPDPSFTYLPVTATVSVDGVGTGTFTNAVVLVSNRSLTRGGVSDLTQNAAMVGLEDTAFANYDLTSSLGPISGAGLRTGGYFPTTLGDFRLLSVGEVTYGVMVVPEPAGALLAIPVAFIAARLRRNCT